MGVPDDRSILKDGSDEGLIELERNTGLSPFYPAVVVTGIILAFHRRVGHTLRVCPIIANGADEHPLTNRSSQLSVSPG